MLEQIYFTAIVVLIYMVMFFVVALFIKDNSIVDIGWGLGFVVVTVANYLTFASAEFIQIFVLILVILWGIRLAVYLFIRNRKKSEDFRYAAWRKQWGKFWIIRSFLQVFIIQGVFMVIIALPVFLIQSETVKDYSCPWLIISSIV